MFDTLIFYPFPFMVVCVRAKESICPCISDDVTMHEVVKGDAFKFLGLGRTKNWIVLCESRQDWVEFVAMYKTCMTHANRFFCKRTPEQESNFRRHQ